MFRIRRINDYQHMSEFNSCWIVAYPEFGLLFPDYTICVDWNPPTIIRILNRWLQEDHTDHLVRSQRDPTTNVWIKIFTLARNENLEIGEASSQLPFSSIECRSRFSDQSSMLSRVLKCDADSQ
ncbi:hypothetical protein TNCV_158821 [Trichonephila clavipes]|uniref:Uncharacterized protein n=1 Tax=Trichonephila clavipes TaxID=2585209 RepID=A0A8X6UZY6_TRICX|nr:hypothetical protein TNCV_158821 [Trichonephila clavipes]